MTTDENIEAAKAATDLPGITRVVTLNLLLDGKHEEALTYLLGVHDGLAGIGHPAASAAHTLRKIIKHHTRTP